MLPTYLFWPLPPPKETGGIVRVVLPLKDQVSGNIVKKQLKDLGQKVQATKDPARVCEPEKWPTTQSENQPGKIERRFGVVMTPFSSSKMIQINYQE